MRWRVCSALLGAGGPCCCKQCHLVHSSWGWTSGSENRLEEGDQEVGGRSCTAGSAAWKTWASAGWNELREMRVTSPMAALSHKQAECLLMVKGEIVVNCLQWDVLRLDIFICVFIILNIIFSPHCVLFLKKEHREWNTLELMLKKEKKLPVNSDMASI